MPGPKGANPALPNKAILPNKYYACPKTRVLVDLVVSVTQRCFQREEHGIVHAAVLEHAFHDLNRNSIAQLA